jgi:predicted metalloprotease
MRLDDERESSYVEDRREDNEDRAGGAGFIGGIGNLGRLAVFWPLIRPLLGTKFGWIIIAVGLFIYIGGNPMALLDGTASTNKSATASDKQKVFISKVLKTTEDVWEDLLPKYGLKYKKPYLVLFRDHTNSGCGFASAQTGPFYCPADEKIYLDLSFFDQLEKEFGAKGDFAQAYVLAHEVGHHVQNLMGILDKIHYLQEQALKQGDQRRANHLQIPVELQADCFAGIWAHYVKKYLEPGDIEEALNAAAQIGDDTIQKKAQGYVVPDSFTHGTSKQRKYWFLRGYKSGDVKSCDTFK